MKSEMLLEQCKQAPQSRVQIILPRKTNDNLLIEQCTSKALRLSDKITGFWETPNFCDHSIQKFSVDPAIVWYSVERLGLFKPVVANATTQ